MAELVVHCADCPCSRCRPHVVNGAPTGLTAHPRSFAELGAAAGFVIAKEKGAQPLAQAFFALVGGVAGAFLDAELKGRK